MALTIYKRLFEVSLIQLYHLDFRLPSVPNGNPDLYYNLSANDQAQLLNNEYDIQRDWEIVPSDATGYLLRNLRMMMKTRPTGFFVGMEAIRQPGDKFVPLIGVKPGTVFTFFIKAKNPAVYNQTAHNLKASLPAKYFFTNRHVSGDGKVAPSLSLPVPAFNASRTWEMGELAKSGSNLQYALKANPSPVDFSAAFPDRQYANISDRTALPKVIRYRFDPKAQPVQTADFVLKTIGPSPTVVKTVAKAFQPGSLVPDMTQVDFRRTEPSAANPGGTPIQDGFYDLDITINGAPFGATQSVYLREDTPVDDSVFAVVEMVHEAGIPDGFHLLNADGSLRTVRIPATPNRWENQAKFEIRLLNRPVFWLYHVQSANGHTVGDVAQLPSGNAAQLITTSPKHLSRAYQQVQYGQNQTQHLPNPVRSELSYDPTVGRFLSEVFITLP